MNEVEVVEQPMSLTELWGLYLEVQEKVRNRPDAVMYVKGKPKGRSQYQKKLKRIKKYALTCVPNNDNEKIYLETILKPL